MTKIYDIQSIPEAIMSEVGGKARGLYKLIHFGYSVPNAFIITDISSDDDFESAVAKYRELKWDKVSVRSSASLEDGNDYSAAGQFSTFLDVEGEEDLKKAIRDCVDSLHNHTAEQYAKTFLNKAESKMTVVVQQMVEARCAGVIFSRAPMRPGYSLVEAVPGLGENLVSGKMSAQQYRVRKDKVEEMPANPTITFEEAITLGAEAQRAEALFGQPMDLEWAIDSQNSIQWLQARPITIEESVTMNELDCSMDNSNAVITTSNIGEVMPGAVTPLNLSVNMYSLDWGVKETYREIGCVDHEVEPYTYICSYYNHMFFNMSSMYTICHSVLGSTKDTMDISICGKVLEGMPDIEMKMNGLRRFLNTITFLKFVFKGDEAKTGMDNALSKLHFDLSQDMHSIYKQIIDNFAALGWVQYYHYRASYYSGGQSNFMMSMIEKDFDNRTDMQSVIAGCLTEIDDFESANVLRMLRSLAKLMLEDNPEVSNFSNEQLADYLDHSACQGVKTEYNAFMAKHGHRGIREMELRCPSWKSNRDSFFTSLRSVLLSCHNGEVQATKHWNEYAEELLSHYSGSKRKRLAGYIDKARKGVCYREYTKSKVVFALDLYKQAYARLAELMVEAHLLPDTDCIYFLLQDEVGQLLNGDTALIKKAIARRRLFPQQVNMKFPDVVLGIPKPLAPTQSDCNATHFQGTPVSRGTVTGKARIVRNEEDAAQLQNGEIMVAACTDIGWTPFYNIIGGLVTEIGSALSHGIVVAREYALPAVVNVENALQNIHTGDEITIDGNSGIIYLNKRN